MNIKNFFKNAFQDMKESAKAQHEVDKVRLEAVKAESRSQGKNRSGQRSL